MLFHPLLGSLHAFRQCQVKAQINAYFLLRLALGAVSYELADSQVALPVLKEEIPMGYWNWAVTCQNQKCQSEIELLRPSLPQIVGDQVWSPSPEMQMLFLCPE